MENTHKITDKEAIKTFMFSGKAIFTLVSSKTNKHITYQVKKHKTDDVFFVSYQVYNEEFRFMGTIFDKKDFRLSRKQYKMMEWTEKKAFEFLMNRVNDEQSLRLDFYHVGKCGRCGRALTDPESIERGLGPSCLKRS